MHLSSTSLLRSGGNMEGPRPIMPSSSSTIPQISTTITTTTSTMRHSSTPLLPSPTGGSIVFSLSRPTPSYIETSTSVTMAPQRINIPTISPAAPISHSMMEGLSHQPLTNLQGLDEQMNPIKAKKKDGRGRPRGSTNANRKNNKLQSQYSYRSSSNSFSNSHSSSSVLKPNGPIQQAPPVNLSTSAVLPMVATSKDINIRKRNVGIPKFLRFLYQMLEMEDRNVICWSHKGSAFQIRQPDELAERILPKYFKHNKVSSFQRQLNYFGFKKWTKTQTNICTFSHPYFIRDDKEKLRMIKRKERGPGTNDDTTTSISPSASSSSSLQLVTNTRTPSLSKGPSHQMMSNKTLLPALPVSPPSANSLYDPIGIASRKRPCGSASTHEGMIKRQSVFLASPKPGTLQAYEKNPPAMQQRSHHLHSHYPSHSRHRYSAQHDLPHGKSGAYASPYTTVSMAPGMKVDASIGVMPENFHFIPSVSSSNWGGYSISHGGSKQMDSAGAMTVGGNPVGNSNLSSFKFDGFEAVLNPLDVLSVHSGAASAGSGCNGNGENNDYIDVLLESAGLDIPMPMVDNWDDEEELPTSSNGMHHHSSSVVRRHLGHPSSSSSSSSTATYDVHTSSCRDGI